MTVETIERDLFNQEVLRVDRQLNKYPKIVESVRGVARDNEEFLTIMALIVDTTREVLDLVAVYNTTILS